METYHGCVRTTADAIKLFEACRVGALPRVQRRLSEKERQQIRPGSVYVWDEREAGMRRWTDGKSWSASRVSGSFLTYREMEGKRGGGSAPSRRNAGRSPEGSRASDSDRDCEQECYRYKTDGLTKQSFSIVTRDGQHLHLISYYSSGRPPSEDGESAHPQPTTDPSLRGINVRKELYPESSFADLSTPAMTRGPMLAYPPPPANAHMGHPPYWTVPWPSQPPPSQHPQHPQHLQHPQHPDPYTNGAVTQSPRMHHPPLQVRSLPLPQMTQAPPLPPATPAAPISPAAPEPYQTTPIRKTSNISLLLHPAHDTSSNGMVPVNSAGIPSQEATVAAQVMSAKALRSLDRHIW